MCLLGQAGLHFPEFLFLVCFRLGQTPRNILSRELEGGIVAASSLYCGKNSLPVCWVAPLRWNSAGPAITIHPPKSSFSFPAPWARCIHVQQHDTGPQLLQNTRTSKARGNKKGCGFPPAHAGFQPLLTRASLPSASGLRAPTLVKKTALWRLPSHLP